MSSAVALQAVVTGLAVGSVYGLVGLGFTLVHRLTRVLNFAQGDLVVGSLFLAVLVVVGTTPVVTSPTVARGAAQVVVALVAGAALSVALYLVAIRPFRSASAAALLAAGLLLREVLALAFTREAYALADPLRLDQLGVVSLPGGASVEGRLFGVLAIGLAAGVAVERFAQRSRTGRAMRAVADDPPTAALMGIPAERMVLLAFALAGVLAGLAGLLSAPGGRATVAGGVVLGLKGTAAALLGRLGSLRGALLAGLGLGVAETLATSWERLGPAYADVLPLTLLVVALALRPPEAVE